MDLASEGTQQLKREVRGDHILGSPFVELGLLAEGDHFKFQGKFLVKALSHIEKEIRENLWELKLHLDQVFERECEQLDDAERLGCEAPHQLLFREYGNLAQFVRVYKVGFVSQICVPEMLAHFKF